MLALTVALVGFGGPASFAQLNLAWDEIGPNNTGNHVRGMVVGSNGTVWAGSVGGGLWKSTTGGASWEQVSSFSDNLAVSAIAVDGDNIYVGTGEAWHYETEGTWGPNPADSLAVFKAGYLRYTSQLGEGVLVSNDGGATWSHNNGTWDGSSQRYKGEFTSIQKVVSEGGRTFVGCLSGLYYSDNANLSTITKASGTSDFMSEPIIDIEFAANGVVYATTADSIYRSTDNGSSFSTGLNSIFPVGTQAPNNRIGGDGILLAVAPSLKSTMYLTGGNGITGNCTGVWKSVDNGYTWVSIAPFESGTFTPFQNAGRYSSFLGVPTNNPDVVFIGGTKMYQYSGSTGWTDAAAHSNFPGFSTRYVPAPQLSIAFDPTNDSTFYIGSDHEIVKTSNLGTTYTARTKGFNNASLYAISASPTWKLATSDRFDGIQFKDNSSSSQGQQQFNQVITTAVTNGGIARWSLINPEYMIIHKGEDRGLQRSLNAGVSLEDFYGFPLDSVNPCFGPTPDSMIIDRTNTSVGGGGIKNRSNAPIMPFCMETYIPEASLASDSLIGTTPDHIYFCDAVFVWCVSSPFGGVDTLPRWNRISNNLIKASLNQGRREYFTAITVSGDADHDVYVGTNYGRLFRIHGANDPVNLCVDTDVIQMDTALTLPERWITDLAVDPRNPNNLVITYGAFADGDDRVYISNDAKSADPTFRSIQGNLEANLPVHSAAFHPEKKVLVIGTEEGVYATDSDFEAGGVTWSLENTGIGNVPVTDVNFRQYYIDYTSPSTYKYAKDNTLFVATNGRGAFKSATLVSREEESFVGSGIRLAAAPNPTVNETSIRFDLPQATKVKMQAFSIDGRMVADLVDRQYGAGADQVKFDTQDLPSGMYIVRAVFENGKGVYRSDLRIVVMK